MYLTNHIIARHIIFYHRPLFLSSSCPFLLCWPMLYSNTPYSIYLNTITYLSIDLPSSHKFHLRSSSQVISHTRNNLHWSRPLRSWNSTLIASGDDSGRMMIVQQPCPRKPKFLTAACHAGPIAKVSSYPVCSAYTANILYSVYTICS